MAPDCAFSSYGKVLQSYSQNCHSTSIATQMGRIILDINIGSKQSTRFKLQFTKIMAGGASIYIEFLHLQFINLLRYLKYKQLPRVIRKLKDRPNCDEFIFVPMIRSGINFGLDY